MYDLEARLSVALEATRQCVEHRRWVGIARARVWSMDPEKVVAQRLPPGYGGGPADPPRALRSAPPSSLDPFAESLAGLVRQHPSPVRTRPGR